MNEYYDDEVYHDEDDFWSDIGEEEDFPWDENPDNSEDKTKEKTIHVVYVEPGEMAVETDIGTELSDLQRAVGGGLIETFYCFDEPVVLVCDDAGKLNGSLPNRAIYDKNGKVEDIIFGPFFICDCSTEDFGSLTTEQAKQYKERFLKPEDFYMMDGEVHVTQYTPHSQRGAR